MSNFTPTLRFRNPEGKYYSSWKNEKLANVADIKTGPFGSTLHQSDYVDVGTPIITVEHLSDHGLVHNNLPLVSDDDKKRLNSYVLQSNDIVFSRVGSVDRNSLVKEEEDGWLFSGRILRIRTNARFIESKFLSYYFQLEFTKYRIRSIAVGQTMPSLNTQILKSFDIILADLDEQRKIVTFLSAVDEKITQLRQKKELLETYKKGCMQQLFSQEIRFKDDSGRNFPGWEEKRLGDVAYFKKGKGISKSDIADNGNNLCIRYGELYTRYNETINVVESRTNADINGLIFSEPNDIIMPASDVTPTGLATASALDKAGVILGSDILIIRSKKLHNRYFSYFITANKNLIIRLVSGVTVYHIYGSDLSTLLIKLPDLEEQQKIANFLSAIDTKIALVTEELKETKTFKKGLLQQMFV